MEFGEKLLPIGLPEKENEELQDGTHCVVTGWKRARVNIVGVTRAALVYFCIFHYRTLEEIVFYRLTKCPGAATLVERVTRRPVLPP